MSMPWRPSIFSKRYSGMPSAYLVVSSMANTLGLARLFSISWAGLSAVVGGVYGADTAVSGRRWTLPVRSADVASHGRPHGPGLMTVIVCWGTLPQLSRGKARATYSTPSLLIKMP